MKTILQNRFGFLMLFGLSLLFLSTPVMAQSTPATSGVCYASTGKSDGGRLLTIDLQTGAGTLVGPQIGDGPRPGLAINSSGEIFATNNAVTASLYRIDATTGARTFVGPVTGALENAQNTEAIAFDANGVLYGLSYWSSNSSGNSKLYTIDTANGAATLIGDTGVRGITGMAVDPTDGTLYASGWDLVSTGSGIYTVDIVTGVATFVGNSVSTGAIPDIAFDTGGSLYGTKGGGGGNTGGGGGGSNKLISISKSTGASTEIGSIGFPSVSGMSCFHKVLSCSGFDAPMDNGPVRVRGKRALPLKANLLGIYGETITGSDIVAAPVVQVFYDSTGTNPPGTDDVSGDALPVGHGDEGNQFVYTDEGVWQFNLKTSNFSAPGVYTVIMESGNAAEYRVSPSCAAEFVIR